MNWTGGELTRAAPTKAKMLKQKQKAHFARARVTATQQSMSRSYQPTADIQHFTDRSLARTTAPTHRQSPPRHELSSTSGIDRDEYRLLMKRQELLRRPDWLDLQATKPLHMGFPTSSDKALIGKRRRIRKVSTARSRVVSTHAHDFHVELPTRGFNARQTSSRQDTSLRIKIGTNALDSQTQHSSLMESKGGEGASADLESLSEEPMLLDSDDDLFEQVTPTKGVRQAHEQSYNQLVGEDALSSELTHPNISAGQDVMYGKSSRLHGSAIRYTPNVDDAGSIASDRAMLDCISAVDDCHNENVVIGASATTSTLPTVDSLDVERRHEYQRRWKRLCGVDTSGHGIESLSAQHTQQHSSSGSSCQPLAQLLGYLESKQVSLSPSPRKAFCEMKDEAVRQMPIPQMKYEALPGRPLAPRVQAFQETSSLHKAEKEQWRRFILGSEHSDSDDSLPKFARPKRYLLGASSPKDLEPLSMFDAESMKHSILATNGARTFAIPSSKAMAGANSSLDGLASCTPTSIKTTAAVASTNIGY